jgi:hypothetical protein
VNTVVGFKRGVFDPDLSLQLRELSLRLQQLLSHRPRLLQPLHRKRLRIRIRPQQLQPRPQKKTVQRGNNPEYTP